MAAVEAPLPEEPSREAPAGLDEAETDERLDRARGRARRGQPQRLSVAELVEKMPTKVRQEWVKEGRPVERYEPDPAEVRADLRRHQRELMAEAYRAQVRRTHSKFVDASLDKLDGDQDVEGRITRWVDSDSASLFLAGGHGLGKSYAAIAIGYAFAGRPASVLLWPAADLIGALDPGSGINPIRLLDQIGACDLLIVDDLGAERSGTEWPVQRLNQVIDARSRNGSARTVYTSNLTYDGYNKPEEREAAIKAAEEKGVEFAPRPDSMLGRYGSRLVDRMFEDAVIVKMRGQSRRRPAPF